ncbi:MAG: hypothetical protein MUF54_23895 [Polyangiaceae bacterium]|jgi:hypothetical protein|nr:hypothetical protein [Polyangiaceae bacterium]
MSVQGIGSANGASLAYSNAEDIARELGGDINAQVAAMMLVHARENQHAAREARDVQEKAIAAEEHAQIAAMRDQADRIREQADAQQTGAWMSGLAGMAAGAVTFYGAQFAGSDATQAAFTRCEGVSTGVASAGKLAGGIYEAKATIARGGATDAETDATAAGHRKQAAERQLDDIKDDARDARDMKRTVLDFLRDMNQSRADAERNAIFQRV